MCFCTSRRTTSSFSFVNNVRLVLLSFGSEEDVVVVVFLLVVVAAAAALVVVGLRRIACIRVVRNVMRRNNILTIFIV